MEHLTAFSLIKSIKPFGAEVLPTIKAPFSGITEGRKRFGRGLHFVVQKPRNRFFEKPDYIFLRLDDLEIEEEFEKTLISDEWLNCEFYDGFTIVISWRVFESSFEVVKLFDYKDLDYNNEDHLYIAVRENSYDKEFPLHLPEEFFEEVRKIFKEYEQGFIQSFEYLNQSFYVAKEIVKKLNAKGNHDFR